jgi:hypothetical protein
MNAHRRPIASLLLTAIASLAIHSHACAQTALTRAEVIAEYQDAVRAGEILAPGDSGQKLNERFPDRYPKPRGAAPATREQVVAELQAATRSGDVLAAGDSGMKLNERSPERYPAPTAAIGKTRDEVRAETLEAIRTGNVLAPGDSGLKLNEISPQRYARTPRQPARDLAVASSIR